MSRDKEVDETRDYGAIHSNDNKTWELNAVLDHIGTGPAQYLIWMVSLLLIYSDYAELSIIAIVLPSLACEFNLSNYYEALVTLSSFGSYALFSMVFGKISDIYGRKKMLICSTMVLLMSGAGAALSHSPWSFLFWRIVTGACVGISFSAALTYSVESNTSKLRMVGPTISGAGASIAIFFTNVLAYYLLGTVGWRWFIIIAAVVPVFPGLVLIIFLPESPRYLCVSGKQDETKKALLFLARLNRRPLPEDISISYHQAEELGSLSKIVSDHLKEIISLSVIYFANIVIEFGLMIFLPLGFSLGFCGKWTSSSVQNTVTSVQNINTTNTTNKVCAVLDKTSLGALSISSFANIIGLVFGLTVAVYIGRLRPLRVMSIFLTMTFIGFYICVNHTVTFVFVWLLKFCEAAVNGMIWIIIPESFPTNSRGTATGFINACGKVGGIVGTTSVYLLFHISPMSVITMFLVASIVTVIGTFVLQRETKDVVLD